MKRPYRWRCFACDKPNDPRATSCATCGFPARATGVEIDRARAAWRAGSPVARVPSSPPAPPRARARWSGWRKGVAIAGAGLLATSTYAWTGTLSWPRLTVALFACMFGAVLFLVACVATDRSDV